jgi:ubiquinol-cytochrome c reductase iron-sulfur subunit
VSDGAVKDAPAGEGEGGANTSRRYFLIQATSAVAAVGAVGAAWPFVKYWTPSAKAKAAGAAVKIDVSKLAPGEMLSPIVAWRGKPIFVVYRDQAVIDSLKVDTNGLADPDSANPDQQPEFAVNPWRSERPELGVYVGICTHLGCSPKYVESENFEETGQGGFFCPCHGSKFDLAGRVVAGVPAPYNLEVPPYQFESDTVIVIG